MNILVIGGAGYIGAHVVHDLVDDGYCVTVYDNLSSGFKENLPENLFIDLMGETLTLTSAYMKKSHLFIGNDSGLMHLSVASNLSTIALFGPTNDKHYGHKGKNCYVVRTKEKYEYFNKISFDLKKSYMLSIEPNHILDVIHKNRLL